MIHSEGNSNQYGFYAVPKALQPKKKYRQPEYEDDYSDDDEYSEDQNILVPIQQQPEDQTKLQRQYYVDQSPYPQFKPRQRGLDFGTQIQKTDLFDYDLQVQPLLQNLVGRSVVSAINQLQEEKENHQRRQALDQYQKKRNAQLMVTQRLQIKNKRKNQESQRRKLQKNIYVKNKQQMGKKIISRRNAKVNLLNLKQQVLDELEEEGFLKKSIEYDLQLEYEDWLYKEIDILQKEQQEVIQVIENMITGQERSRQDEHKKYIEKQRVRRQGIKDEQQRVRKANEERKRKKKVRKERLKINQSLKDKAKEVFQDVNDYDPNKKILKSQLGNGLTKHKNSNETVHIAGGLLNYVIAFLNSHEKQFTSEEIEAFLQKLLPELKENLEVVVSNEHHQKLLQLKQKHEEDSIGFMKDKAQKIAESLQKIKLDFSLFSCLGVNVKLNLQSQLLESILNIYINSIPSPKKEGEQIVESYEASEKDRKREKIKNKIVIRNQEEKSFNNLQTTQHIIRVHFEKEKQRVEESEKQQIQQQRQKTQEEILNQWIDVYDGEAWTKNIKQRQDYDKSNQCATSYSVKGVENALIIDHRNISFLRTQLENLFEIEAGQSLKQYEEGLHNIRAKIGEIPVFDIQMKWQ